MLALAAVGVAAGITIGISIVGVAATVVVELLLAGTGTTRAEPMVARRETMGVETCILIEGWERVG